MIMGLSANLDWWDPRLIRKLSKRFKTVLFDNRGAGRTEVSDRKYTIELFADDTAGLMDALGIPTAHVCGISMGGMIAQELALRYPDKVERLVLCSTNCGGAESILPSKEVLEILTADVSKLPREEVARMIIPLFFTRDFISENRDFIERWTQQILRALISREAYMRQLNAIMEFNTCNRLAQIRAPTLILHGKKDILVPPENASILSRGIQNTKLIYLENSGHGLVEELEKLIGVLLDFLRGR